MTTTTPTTEAVAALVAQRRTDGDWCERFEVLAAQAAKLAAAIDASDNVRATAEGSRELRQVLDALKMDDEFASKQSWQTLMDDLGIRTPTEVANESRARRGLPPLGA